MKYTEYIELFQILQNEKDPELASIISKMKAIILTRLIVYL
jgi:hypothetical protein